MLPLQALELLRSSRSTSRVPESPMADKQPRIQLQRHHLLASDLFLTPGPISRPIWKHMAAQTSSLPAGELVPLRKGQVAGVVLESLGPRTASSCGGMRTLGPGTFLSPVQWTLGEAYVW